MGWSITISCCASQFFKLPCHCMSLYHVSRLNLISEIEEDQCCEVAGINYRELVVAVLSKRIAYENNIKTKSYDSCLCILLGQTIL
jgi:hypothetical protein